MRTAGFWVATAGAGLCAAAFAGVTAASAPTATPTCLAAGCATSRAVGTMPVASGRNSSAGVADAEAPAGLSPAQATALVLTTRGTVLPGTLPMTGLDGRLAVLLAAELFLAGAVSLTLAGRYASPAPPR